MKQPAPDAVPVSPEFARRYRERAAGAGPLSTAAFIEFALYDPEVGYYRSSRRRVGTGGESDFYTASSMAEAFGPLVAEAAANLLGPEAARDTIFVEVGAEPGRSVLDGVDHRFAEVRMLRLGDPLIVPSRAVVFSNELFDAQPFHRLVARGGAWHELGVSLDGDGRLVWVTLDETAPEIAAVAGRLPAPAREGYVLDLPIAAVRLLQTLLEQSWSGLFLAFDYGRTWDELVRDYPQGTGRGYRRHRQSGDLLAAPGEQDITCHVCWDWLEGGLRTAGFAPVRRQSQESFFVHHATAAIERIMTGPSAPLSRARSQMRQLLHPALLGQRFEALWGLREAGSG